VSGPYRMRLAVEGQSFNVGADMLGTGIAACDAFVAARAGLVRSDAARELVKGKKVGDAWAKFIDPSARKEVELLAKAPPVLGGVGIRKPARKRVEPTGGGGGAALVAGAGLLGAGAWWLSRRRGS